MRNSLFFCSAVGLFAALSPALLCAQFQPPNPDELKMTSDPKAPGADAVYLDMSEFDNDALRFRTHYARIKVLTEKGKELATVTAPFAQGRVGIGGIQARTIHPDGTIVPLIMKPEDLLSMKNGDVEFDRKVFTLPDVTVGSVLEYSYDLQYPDATNFYPPHWEIQQPYFVHKAHFEFKPGYTYANLSGNDVHSTDASVSYFGGKSFDIVWAERLPKDADVKKDLIGNFSLDLTDIAPIPREEWMPPVRGFFYEVTFRNASDTTPFWQNAGKTWSKNVDDFAEQSKAIKDAASSLIAPTDSDLEKARKMYDAVEALDNSRYSRVKGESERKDLNLKDEKHAGETWAQKSGGPDGLALLFLAMLRAAGLTAYAAEVVDRDKGIFDPAYLRLDQLDTVLVILDSGGKQIVLDPGDKMCPFATVGWRHSYASGLGQSARGVSITITPQQQYAENTIKRTGILSVDAQGGVSGQIQIAMTGQEALRWRQLALENDESQVKKQFDDELAKLVPDGVQAHVDHFAAMDDPNATLNAVANVTGSLGVPAGKRLIVPTFFFETRGTVPFVSEAVRLLPVDMHYPDRVTDQITYRLPDGLTVEGAPQDANFSWPTHALFVAKSLTQPSQITVAQTLTRAFTLAKPEEYQDLRGFYQKVAAADQGQLVLTATTKNGN
jgi:hypothetical protein